MKYLSAFFCTLLFSVNVFATDLCESSCNLLITFPEGGSIEATEALTITFGSMGWLNLGATGTINTNPQPDSPDFLAGGTLQLAKGDSISFDINGSIHLGVGGNIDYSDMLINSAGDASLKAVDGSESINIQNLTLEGGLYILVDAASISVNGNLTIDAGGTLTIVADTDAIVSSACSVQDESNAVTITAGTGIDTSGSCSQVTQDLTISGGVITSGSIDDVIFNSGSDLIVVPGVIVLEDEIILNPTLLTQEILSSLIDGAVLPTEDGKTCTMSGGECFSEDGQKYIAVGGVLVPEENAGGIFNLFSLFLLSLLVLLSKINLLRRQVIRHHFRDKLL